MNTPPYDTSGRKCPKHTSAWIKSNNLEHPDGSRERVRYCPVCVMEQAAKQQQEKPKAAPQLKILKI